MTSESTGKQRISMMTDKQTSLTVTKRKPNGERGSKLLFPSGAFVLRLSVTHQHSFETQLHDSVHRKRQTQLLNQTITFKLNYGAVNRYLQRKRIIFFIGVNEITPALLHFPIRKN
ncbi:uncharacterized protein LOC135165088 [Diachasmimorpha longicaudata]|uniref:uncharacterized protein LOC135165088 n=1 Tax=Diachasmimorpha longicaudata TaxID=58733 RepID=UPI0030B90581